MAGYLPGYGPKFDAKRVWSRCCWVAIWSFVDPGLNAYFGGPASSWSWVRCSLQLSDE